MTQTFDLFWSMYPRRVAKLAAQKAWAKLTPAECEKALAVLADHIASWSDRDMDKVPHAATWINGKRFEDELTPQRQKAIGPLSLVAREPVYDYSWQDECRAQHGFECNNAYDHDIRMTLEAGRRERAAKATA